MAVCGQKTTIYSRVCGYYRPIHDEHGKPIWNKGKIEEWRDRLNFDLNKSQQKKAKNSA